MHDDDLWLTSDLSPCTASSFFSFLLPQWPQPQPLPPSTPQPFVVYLPVVEQLFVSFFKWNGKQMVHFSTQLVGNLSKVLRQRFECASNTAQRQQLSNILLQSKWCDVRTLSSNCGCLAPVVSFISIALIRLGHCHSLYWLFVVPDKHARMLFCEMHFLTLFHAH